MFIFLFILRDRRLEIRATEVHGIEEDGEVQRQPDRCGMNVRVIYLVAEVCEPGMWSAGVGIVCTRLTKWTGVLVQHLTGCF